MKSIPAGRVYLILSVTLAISLIYYFIGSPRFYENNLGAFTEAGKYGFLAPSLYQFAVTLVLLFFVPLLMIRKIFRQSPADYGWRSGDRKAEAFFLWAGIPIVLLLSWLSSGDEEFARQYPLFISQIPGFRLQGQNITVFILYEFTYVFYYIGWEFFFRGFAFLGIYRKTGLIPALLFQAVLSTVLHVSKPLPELVAALPGGIIFGLVALRCRSLKTVIILHWLLGCSLDLFILLR